MVRLLDPIEDDDTLDAFLRNPGAPRWGDGSLDALVEQRLASECLRFFRVVERMKRW